MAEPLNATFFAFKKREQGGVLLRTAVSFAIGLLLLFVVFGAIAWFVVGGEGFMQWYGGIVEAAGKGAADPPPPNIGGLFLLVPIYFLVLFAMFVLLAAFESAALRWMINGERSGPLNLCFGADMWRVYGTYWAWLLFFMLTGILFWIVILIIGLAAGGALGSENDGATAMVVLGACFIWVIGWIYVAIRLAPAAATSIGIGRFAPLKAWSVSADRFWAIFGAFVLITLIYFAVSIVFGIVFLSGFYGAVFSQLDWSLASTDPVAFNQAYERAMLQAMQAQFANPMSMALYIGGQVVMYAVGLVFYLLYFGVSARAVQAALEEGKIEREAAA